jgi:hypothetical protein
LLAAARRLVVVLVFLGVLLMSGPPVQAEDIGAPSVEMYPAIQSGSFVEGNTFEVPIVINTRGQEISIVQLELLFDPTKLAVVSPSGGVSIMGIWSKAPTYNNAEGVLVMGGIVTGGITTEAGLITTVTFKAIASGPASVQIGPASEVVLNDGQGTEAKVQTIRGSYTLLPQPSGAVNVYSATHPLQDRWYNNPSPVIAWDKEPEVTQFATVLDNKPNTIPDEAHTTDQTQEFFSNLSDGVWYFHIKAAKGMVWGATAHFPVRIDTISPSDFSPQVTYLGQGSRVQAQVAFSTTDSHSGLARYEVGVLEPTAGPNDVPVFIEARSPYQLLLSDRDVRQVTIRAVDQAGNVRDVTVRVSPPASLVAYLQANLTFVLLFAFGGILVLIFFHYLIGHHILAKLRLLYRVMRRVNQDEYTAETKTLESVERLASAVKPDQD